MANVGTVTIGVVANTGQLISGFQRAQSVVMQFQQQTSSMFSKLVSLGAGLGAGGLFGFAVKEAASLERNTAAFRVLIGDATKAAAVFADLRKYSQTSTIGFSDVSRAAQTLMSFGVAANDVGRIVRNLGDISMGSTDRFQSLALAFAQSQAAGRLMGQDLLQMVNAGFNPLKVISDQTGISLVELRKKMEQGAISSQMVAEAFRIARFDGVNFNGSMQEMMKTTAGQFSLLKSQATNLAIEIGEMLLPAANRVIASFSQLVTWCKGLGEAFKGSAVRIAAWVAAVVSITYISVQVVKAIGTIVAAIRTLATAQAIGQALSGPKGWAALATGFVIAAGAAYGVNRLFSEVNETMAATSVAAAEATKETSKLFDELKTTNIDNLKDVEKDAKNAEKELDKLRSRAESIRESLRMPSEVFQDTVAELKSLSDAGLIDVNIFARGIDKAKAEYLDAIKKDFQAELKVTTGIGAAQAGTSAGFSAIQEGRRTFDAIQEQRKTQEKQLAEQAKANKLLEGILNNTKAPTLFNEVRL